MYTFVRKLGHTGYSLRYCIRALDFAFIPVSQAKQLLPRGFGGGGARLRPPYHESYNEEYYDDSYGRLPPPRERDRLDRTPVYANCGELRYHDTGTMVRMQGRVQCQRLNRFVTLRDSNGTTQFVAPEERLDLLKGLRNIPLDSLMEVIGTVALRPNHTINTSMPTGEIEVIIEQILDVAAPKRKMWEPSGEDVSGSSAKKTRSSLLLTSSEIARCDTPAVQRKFNQRTHSCSDLCESLVNSDVVLVGWIDNKRNDRFVILRDGYGTAQLVINTNDLKSTSTMQKAEHGTVVTVKGKVSMRPPHQRNNRMATGNVEVKVTSVETVDSIEQDPVDDEVSVEPTMVQESTPSTPPPGDVNSYSSRTHTCGQLRGSDVGQDVVLCGWLHSHRGSRFATIRDGHGSTQLLVPSQLESTTGREITGSTLESVIRIVGTVAARPVDQVNETVATGEIEVLVKEFSLLNAAKRDMPFIVRDHNKPKENLRMKYRYLDMRFPDMQRRLRMRSQVLMRMREFLIDQRGFVEVETPTLFRRTPGGAQEYVVPTRSQNKFYSLVQSPQQLKQLLMVGAMDRYFQVARCYRDEGARPDRQPEFTQMDIELSFTDAASIRTLVEDLLSASWPKDLGRLVTPFRVLSYHDAMHSYGTDKPNLSFDHKLVDISQLLTEEAKQTLPQELTGVKNFTIKALVLGHNIVGHKLGEIFEECEKLQKKDAKSKAKLILVKCPQNEWMKPLTESLPFIDAEKFKAFLDLPTPSSVLVGYGKDTDVLPLLGKLRQEVFCRNTSEFHFTWIVDFPLFEEDNDGSLVSSHHPFTQPCPEDSHLLLTNPLQVRGQHFDLVLNGFEVGGGSVRIHDAALQTQVLKDILNIPVDSLAHLLEALGSGAPPHGGIALGMDRLLSIMVGADSIRDVIAFPKGVDGKDPLSGAPCPISDEEKRMYHLLPRGGVRTNNKEVATSSQHPPLTSSV